MRKYYRFVIVALTCFIASCTNLHTTHQDLEHEQHVPSKQHVVALNLDAELSQLLRQEMQAIQTGMMSLIPAIASGDWDEVASIGKKMQGSYILKQKLTPEQRHALHGSLPAEFIKRDQAFHQDAGMLAHAAEMGHPDIVNFYLYKLTTACVECHTEFASQRFPNLVLKQESVHHH
ncbi:MAG: hypothetical protein GQ581_01210 [Methyloprofundus sp.]|nr:hypothetical protein [Methyloprofundus sp.]